MLDERTHTPAIIGEAVAGRTATVRERIKTLSAAVEANTFELGELFYEAQENGYPQKWGYQSLGEYAVVELGIKHRKAQYLSHIVRVTKACGIQRRDYQPAGVTKLRAICSLDPDSSYFNTETKQHEDMAEHITALVAVAPELDTKEVEERVAHLKGLDGDNAMLTKSYSVTKSAYENTVKPALEAMRKILGSKGRDGTGAAMEYSDGACLEFICRDWLNDPSNYMEEADESHVQIEVENEVDKTDTGIQVPSE